MTSQMTSQPVLIPTLSLSNGQIVMTSQMTPLVTGMPSQGMMTQVPTSLMRVTSEVPRDLIPMSSNVNVIGSKGRQDGAILFSSLRGTKVWVEPGRIEPPSAFTFNDFISPADYISNFSMELTVVKLDSAKELWTIADEYIILAENNLPCKEPTFWTLGSVENCTQLIWPKETATASGTEIVIGNVVGNYKGGKVEDVTVINSDSDDDQTEDKHTKSMLKVKSFAKCKQMDNSEETYPDILVQIDRCYKKLTDKPVVYALMVSVVSSTEECDGLLRDRAALHAWHRPTGVLSALDVSAPRDILPTGNREALLVRHPDSRFLNDMAGKFQRLNSENALIRENQVYVFAPNTGKLLVAPSE